MDRQLLQKSCFANFKSGGTDSNILMLAFIHLHATFFK